MRIEREIANLERPIGSGIEREAFYLKKYNIIIKLPKRIAHQTQSYNEYCIFQKLTKEEKELFPAIEFVETSKGLAIVMKKVSVVGDLLDKFQDFNITEKIQNVLRALNYSDEMPKIDTSPLKRIGITDTSSFERLFNFKMKYELRDFHFNNLGVVNGKLVAIDLGLKWGDEISWDGTYNTYSNHLYSNESVDYINTPRSF